LGINTLFNSINYSARDSQQTQLLIRKYFRKGDILVHSDLENSCIVIIKNMIEDGVVPPGTLAQAGIMAVATSRAWEVKQGTLFFESY
jgi:predicted ribosome quality control (RQC) complex YloA/Tae2 family protein